MAKKSKTKKLLASQDINGQAPAIKGKAADSDNILHTVAFWGLAVLLFLPPFFRGLFFAPEQQKALFFAVLVFWLVWTWKWMKGDGKFLSHPLDYLVLAFPAVYLFSAFNAANTGLAVDEIVKTLLYFLVYWVVANLVSDETDVVRIFKVICLTGVFVSLAGLAAATGQVYIKDSFLGGRIYSTFQYPNALASYLMTVIFLSLYIWLRDNRLSLAGLLGLNEKGLPGFVTFNAHRYLYILVSYTAFVVFIGAKSNGGFLVFILALAVYFTGLPKGRRIPAAFHLVMAGGPAVPCALMFVRYAAAGSHTRAWLLVLAGALAVILLQCLYNYLEKKGLLELISRRRIAVVLLLAVIATALALAVISYVNTHSQAVAVALEQFRTRNAVERFYFYRDALKMVAGRPLLGWGGGGWQEAYRMFQGYLYNSTEVHGHYLQIAVETGVTGLLVMVSIWAAFLQLTYRGLKNSRENPGRKLMLWTVFTSAIALGAHAVIDFDLSLSALALVLWAMWGLMRGMNRAGAPESVPEPSRYVKRPAPAFVSVSVSCLVLLFITGCFVTASGSAGDSSKRLRGGDLKGAVNLMEKATYYNPFNADYNSDLATLYARQGKLEQAAGQAQEAIAKSKYSAARYNNLAGLYINMNKSHEAMTMAEKAVELAPFQIEWYDLLARTYFAAGYILMQKGNNSEAAGILTEATRVEERINQQAAKLGPLEKSLWKVAPMLAPSVYTRLYSGASYCLLDQYPKAETLLQAVSEDSKADNRVKAESYLWLSLIYQRQGQQARSDEALAQARQMVPDVEKQFPHIYRLIKK
ncbi:MAG: O-antigen ligase family protein [Peptococcaceae bacterium]|nr:O-antigen ligase family protein [Peptococcaceae bacterium]